MAAPNHRLRHARERMPSERVPGCVMSRSELAAKVNAWLRQQTRQVFPLDERAIGRWERGAVRRPSEHYRVALRAVLGADSDTDLGFDGPPQPAMARAAAGEPPTVEAIQAMAGAFHAADRKLGGGQLYATVISYLRSEVANALFDATAGKDVFPAAASLTEVAAWMAHDAGMDTAAQHHFGTAYRLAVATDSRALAANMCASMSHLASSLHQDEDALRLAETGLDHARFTGGIARVAARLHAMRARALAGSRRRDEALCELNRAASALRGGNDHEHAHWSAHFDEASLAAETASTLHHLGDLAGAEAQARQVIALRVGDRVRARAFGHLTLASILVDAGRTDEAATIGTTVCRTAASISSARVHVRLGDLAVTLRGQRPSTDITQFLDGMTHVDTTAARRLPEWPV